MTELSEPGPFMVLSNRDAEANNLLVHAAGPADARLIGFEAAGFTHAPADAVCLYVPGPGWLSVGDPVASGLADEHRHALARGIPQAEDDRLFGRGLSAACLSWAVIRRQRFPVLDARVLGDNRRCSWLRRWRRRPTPPWAAARFRTRQGGSIGSQRLCGAAGPTQTRTLPTRPAARLTDPVASNRQRLPHSQPPVGIRRRRAAQSRALPRLHE
ncbi:hypothetical protein [Streptomyces sp. NPDC057689]|uniref:hypothetical protein n=1 Tax=Streptomyces sp. NPDC057689 TaxID=3346213 RepID=UPI0036A748D1